MKTNAIKNPIFFLVLVLIGFITAVRVTAQTRLARTTPAAADAQLTKEDYARANQMGAGILLRKLKNGFVVPHWIGQRDEFWYKRGDG